VEARHIQPPAKMCQISRRRASVRSGRAETVKAAEPKRWLRLRHRGELLLSPMRGVGRSFPFPVLELPLRTLGREDIYEWLPGSLVAVSLCLDANGLDAAAQYSGLTRQYRHLHHLSVVCGTRRCKAGSISLPSLKTSTPGRSSRALSCWSGLLSAIAVTWNAGLMEKTQQIRSRITEASDTDSDHASIPIWF
jgi:hypothetical protein